MMFDRSLCQVLLAKAGKIFARGSFYFLQLIIFSSTANYAFAQSSNIDNLRRSLPALHDVALADCLNDLGLAYCYLNADSANYYAKKALLQSSSIHYVHGIIIAWNNKATIAGITSGDFRLQEKICNQTIRLYKNVKNENGLIDTYLNLSLAFFCQSKFDSSSEACSKTELMSKENDNRQALGEATAIRAAINFETGNYEKSFQYYNESLTIFKSIKDSFDIAIVLAKLGDLYHLAGDSKTSFYFYFQSLHYPQTSSSMWRPLVDLGDTYYSLEQYDTSIFNRDKYLQTIKYLTVKSNYIVFPNLISAEKYIGARRYDSALKLLSKELKQAEWTGDNNRLMRILLDLSKMNEQKNDFKKALYYANQLLQVATKNKVKQYIRDSYQLMYILYGDLNKTNKAYYYFRRYTYMKDYVALDDFSKKLAIYKAATESEKKQAQITLLNKEKVIGRQDLQLSNQTLKNELFIKKILISGVLILIFFGIIIFRNSALKRRNEAHRHEIAEQEFRLQKAESERTKIEWQQQATELELKALRAQMNPHFIFNCLNSINTFIISNNAKMAADHLTKFAKLIRMVLEQSGKSFIPLEDELTCLRLYMDLEALRFDIPFHYKINKNDFDVSTVMIPSLLLQPFVENAIWHGLQGTNNFNGQINIDIKLYGDILYCSIKDNGRGRRRDDELNNKAEKRRTSFGIDLTNKRLQLIDPSKSAEVGIYIEDLVDSFGEGAGTCIHINVPVMKM
jgi:tetratricopeptide (TPR) repeat protein